MLRICRSRLHARAGLNLVEAAIVLGVVGLVIGGVFAAYASMRDSNNIKEQVHDTSTLVNNIRASYTTVATTETAAATAYTTALINTGIAPKSMVASTGTSLVSVWGTALTVAANGATFDITIASIPSRSQCTNFVAQIYNDTINSGLASINSTAVTTGSAPQTVALAACATSPYQVVLSYKIK